MSKYQPGQIVLRTKLDEAEYKAKLSLAVNQILDVVTRAERVASYSKAAKGRKTQLGNSRNR